MVEPVSARFSPDPPDPSPDQIQPESPLDTHPIAPEPERTRPKQPPASRNPSWLTGPYEVVMAWGLWILGNWITCSLTASSAIAVPWMMTAALTGMMILWPLLRLSQAIHSPHSAVASYLVILDWIALTLVFHATLWPTWAAAGWSILQTLQLSLVVHAWSLLAGAALAWGLRVQTPVRRAASMACCLFILMGAPAIQSALFFLSPPLALWLGDFRASPIVAVWALLDHAQPTMARGSVFSLAAPGVLALACWTTLLRSSGTMKLSSRHV